MADPPRPRDLRPDAGVSRLQCAVGRVPANRFGSRRRRTRLAANRRHSRSRRPIRRPGQARPARRRSSEMHAETAWGRHRIDEAREGRAPAQGKVIALARYRGGIFAAGMPAIECASACAPRPAAFTTTLAAIRVGAGPPVSMTSPLSGATGEDRRSERDHRAMSFTARRRAEPA